MVSIVALLILATLAVAPLACVKLAIITFMMYREVGCFFYNIKAQTCGKSLLQTV